MPGVSPVGGPERPVAEAPGDSLFSSEISYDYRGCNPYVGHAEDDTEQRLSPDRSLRTP